VGRTNSFFFFLLARTRFFFCSVFALNHNAFPNYCSRAVLYRLFIFFRTGVNAANGLEPINHHQQISRNLKQPNETSPPVNWSCTHGNSYNAGVWLRENAVSASVILTTCLSGVVLKLKIININASALVCDIHAAPCHTDTTRPTRRDARDTPFKSPARPTDRIKIQFYRSWFEPASSGASRSSAMFYPVPRVHDRLHGPLGTDRGTTNVSSTRIQSIS